MERSIDVFAGLPRGHFRAILADPPWHFEAWASPPYGSKGSGQGLPDYRTMQEQEISALPVREIAADDCVLFLWTCWPMLEQALRTIVAWGFKYKTCGFAWMKADQYRLFALEEDIRMGLGHWTRANTEVCLLATRGQPKRQDMGVRQGILEPIREHSRKPDCVYERIERLVAGPYLELFARMRRPGWTSWGNEVEKFAPPVHWHTSQTQREYDPDDDLRRSLEDCYAAIRARKAAGGPGWPQEETFADRVIREGNALARKLKHFR